MFAQCEGEKKKIKMSRKLFPNIFPNVFYWCTSKFLLTTAKSILVNCQRNIVTYILNYDVCWSDGDIVVGDVIENTDSIEECNYYDFVSSSDYGFVNGSGGVDFGGFLRHNKEIIGRKREGRWSMCQQYQQVRHYANILPEETFQMSCTLGSSTPMGLVLGCYCDEDDYFGDSMKFTDSGKKYDHFLHGKLKAQIKMALPPPKLGQVRIFYGLDDKFNAVAVTGLGSDCVGYNPVEELDEQKEIIRSSSAVGTRALQELNIPKIYCDTFGHAESAAEGSNMAIWLFQQNKADSKRLQIPRIEMFDSCDWIGWQIGQQKALAQNLARELMEMPSNILTPHVFALQAVDVLTKAGVNVEVKVRNWCKLRDLNAFLSVSNGSCQPPIFLEAYYEGCQIDVAPAVLIGKGVTFDSGGICLKNCKEMKDMRGDMAGAASVVAAIRAVSNLQIPVNVRALIPLCENLPGACGYKPGDIIMANNGKTIMVQNTAYEGRLLLADALSYSRVHNPKFIVDIGTLTREISEVLGASACGVFTNSDSLYDTLRIASIHTGDRVWRFPLWEYYSEDVRNTEMSDVLNVGSDNDFGGACNAAAFLKEFVPEHVDWMHIDSYGVSLANGDGTPYLRNGMTGRPTRTLVEFLSQLACRHVND